MRSEFILRLTKMTDFKACFRDNADRLGRTYLHRAFVQAMNISDALKLQLAKDQDTLPAGGYRTTLIKDKETENKIRFREEVTGGGELGEIYVNKTVVEYLELGDRIAARLSPADHPFSSGGEIAIKE